MLPMMVVSRARLYFGASWIPFVIRPKIHAEHDIPEDALTAVKDYCRESDYLWKHHWGISGSTFWQEPFTHRELKMRRIEVTATSPTRIRAFCPSSKLAVWFDLAGEDWRLDQSQMLTF